jgi:plasmid maintenance system antidote protein VapI
MRLVARHILVDQMARKGWSNRGLAEFVGCAPGTIDNLVAGRTQSVNGQTTARRISEALELPVEVFFIPVSSSVAIRDGNGKTQPASGEGVPAEEDQRQIDPEF